MVRPARADPFASHTTRSLFSCVCPRYVILNKDFEIGYSKHVKKADAEHQFYT